MLKSYVFYYIIRTASYKICCWWILGVEMNLEHAHKTRFWYLLGVMSKFSNENPRPFYRRVSLPPGGRRLPSYYNSGRSRTDFKISLQYSSRFHIISKESIWCKRMRVLNYSLQGTLGCSNWFRTDRRGRGFTESSLAWFVLMRKKVITRLCPRGGGVL